jgi:pyruvate/2-oxoglutarate dehydrogenase complex dihydrolipoamide acyltransferase (E2) component
MAQRIDMPSLGQTADEVVIVEWFKKEGETVALGEPLLSIQTDKAQVDVESVAAGTLLKVLRDVGETVRGGSPVAYIGAAGEAVPASHAGDEEISGSANGATAAFVATEGSVPVSAPGAEPEHRSPANATGQVSALPAARRLAGELRVDLSTIGGTGQDGVITVRDVEQAAQEASALGDDAEGRAT